MQDPVAPFLEGNLIDSAGDGVIDVFSPSSGRRLFSIPTGCKADVDRAVLSARSAFDAGRWCDIAPAAKKRVLYRFADLIATNSDTLDVLDAGEMGKPVSLQFGSAASSAGLMRFYAEAVDKIGGHVYVSDKSSFVTQRRVPRGVVAAIVPWNFPTYAAVLKIGPALAAGNCVVLKPSELSSRSAIHLAHLAIEAGIPPGVLNVVPGLGSTVGEALGLHGDVDMITFTGSTTVGKRIMQYAGQSNMKVVMTECGGKSPQIVFGDGVDLAAVSETIARALLVNQGQVCSVGSRLLVHKSIEAEVLEHVTERMRRVIVGDALDPRTTFGPVASAAQCARILSSIEGARSVGARVVTGGRQLLPETGGHFVEPTVICNVSPDARIAQEEIFGPVLSVISFNDEADAIRIANGTIYGLAANVWTANLSTAMRVAKSIRSSVRINATAALGEGPGHAYSSEPTRQSGVGVEGGLAGMESYLGRQSVWISHG